MVVSVSRLARRVYEIVKAFVMEVTIDLFGGEPVRATVLNLVSLE
jgi:hypothetical protein